MLEASADPAPELTVADDARRNHHRSLRIRDMELFELAAEAGSQNWIGDLVQSVDQHQAGTRADPAAYCLQEPVAFGRVQLQLAQAAAQGFIQGTRDLRRIKIPAPDEHGQPVFGGKRS